LGRSAIGLDIDPVAAFIAEAKTRYIGCKALRNSTVILLRHIKRLSRTEKDYEQLQFRDISQLAYARTVNRYRLKIPQIPNIFHWFRRYVVVDLAQLRSTILRLHVTETHKRFFLACLCSIIRNVSNADPVPVSGLEVTSHMKAKDANGRITRPFRPAAVRKSG